MSPEQQQINELKAQVKVLSDFIKRFENAGQVDPLVANTMTKLLTTTTSKTAASATKAVNESGASSYNVMFPPDGFIKIGGKNVPYIN